jgi:hypothetical protein
LSVSELEPTEVLNMHLVAHHDLGGHGDCMHVNVKNGVAYIGHMGYYDHVGTSIVDVSNPRKPELITEIEVPAGTHSHKVQVVGNTLLVNHERNPYEPPTDAWSAGVAIYDISDPANPQQRGFYETPGNGTHRMTYWTEPYAYITGTDFGYSDQFLQVVDLSDPSAPREVSRWWLPGMNIGAGEQPSWAPNRHCKLHHTLLAGDRAYCPWWDLGFTIMDMSDLTAPTMITHFEFGEDLSGNTHTAMPVPARDLLVVTDEECSEATDRVMKQIRVVDISNEKKPAVLSTFPAPPDYFVARGGRSGPHNLHEMRPGTYRSDHIIFATYFNAGIRVFDITDPEHPREIAYFVPRPPDPRKPIQLNDLTVGSDGLIYVSDRVAGGLYILEADIDL